MAANQTGRGRRQTVDPVRRVGVLDIAVCSVVALCLSLAEARHSDAKSLDALIEQCATCHGEGSGPPASLDTPILGGQSELYALYQLVYFRNGQRKQPVMNELVQNLADDDLRALAKWVGSLSPAPPGQQRSSNPDRYQSGEALARRHRCPICHDTDYLGRDHIPRLAGQREQYLLKALNDYKTGARVGIQAAMAEVLAEVDDDGLEDLAHFLAHYSP